MRRTLAALVLAASVSAAAAPAEPECVVVLHGIGMGPWVMRPLAAALEDAGYRVVNLAYPSRALPIERIAGEFLPAALAEHGVARAPRVHFVAHSMGGLVTRLHLRDHRPPNLGRVVLLGPPNHGSAAADSAARLAPLRALLGVNLVRLGTGPEAVTPALPRPDHEVGVIAGTGRLNPLFAGVMTGPHDGVVAVESARLEGQRDFLVLPYSHTGMLFRAEVHRQVAAFLREGRFVCPRMPGGHAAQTDDPR